VAGIQLYWGVKWPLVGGIDSLYTTNNMKEEESILNHLMYQVLMHEIITPLIGIRGAAQRMDGLIKRGNFDMVDTYSNSIASNAEHTIQLFRSYQFLFDIDEQEELKNINIINFNQEIQSALNLAYWENYQVVVKTDFSETSNCKIKYDINMLRILIYNLLSNAVKFSSPKSFVIMKSYTDTPDDIVLEIVNYGPTMEKKFRNRIFDYKFSTSHETGKRGQGLGLYICKKVSEKTDCEIIYDADESKMENKFKLIFKSIK